MAYTRSSEELFKIANQIRLLTEAIDRGEITAEALFTSSDLARLFGISRDTVKKHLKYLKDLGLVQTVGYSPKRYRFDHFNYRQFLQSEPAEPVARELLNRMLEQISGAGKAEAHIPEYWA